VFPSTSPDAHEATPFPLSSQADDLAAGEVMKPMNRGEWSGSFMMEGRAGHELYLRKQADSMGFSLLRPATTRLLGITYKSVHWEEPWA
jgi:hypothetical protein